MRVTGFCDGNRGCFVDSSINRLSLSQVNTLLEFLVGAAPPSNKNTMPYASSARTVLLLFPIYSYNVYKVSNLKTPLPSVIV